MCGPVLHEVSEVVGHFRTHVLEHGQILSIQEVVRVEEPEGKGEMLNGDDGGHALGLDLGQHVAVHRDALDVPGLPLRPLQSRPLDRQAERAHAQRSCSVDVLFILGPLVVCVTGFSGANGSESLIFPPLPLVPDISSFNLMSCCSSSP